MRHEKKTIFNTRQIESLKELYHSLPFKKHGQYYNIFNIEKRVVQSTEAALNPLREFLSIENNATDSYFLRYTPGSFTCLHVDNPDRVLKTIITLVHTSSDLEGGDAVLIYERAGSREQGKLQKVPVVCKQEVGSSLIYGHNVTHGVSPVNRGERIVLVTWVCKHLNQ